MRLKLSCRYMWMNVLD